MSGTSKSVNPTQVRHLLGHPVFMFSFLLSFLSTNPMVKAATHLSSVETVSGGAAPFGPALIEKFMAKCAPNVVK